MTNIPSESESLSQFAAPTNPLTIPLPLGWTLPQFQFGQVVNSTEGRGEIIGLQYIHPSNPASALFGAGWQYFITIPVSATSGALFPVEVLPESHVWEIAAS